MLNTKGVVALTKYQQMGWRLIKVENSENLSDEIFSFTSNFDIEKSLTGSIKTIQQ